MTVIVMLDVRPAQAIPAFARREGIPCQMCHFRMPELNEAGRAYMRRGLREESRATGESASPANEVEPLGAPLNINLANYVTVMGAHTFTAEKHERASFNAGDIDLWFAGPFDPHWSALADIGFSIDDGGSSVDLGYGQYNTRWSEKFNSARFGQVLPFAISFNQGGPSMSLSQPVVLSTALTSSAWTPTSNLRGVEVGAVNSPNWNAYLGAGQPQVDELGALGFKKHTDIFASAEKLFCKGNSVSLYGYWGHAWFSGMADDEPFHRLGILGNGYWPKTKGVAGYVTGRDRGASGADLDNSGYFLLGERLISDRWAAYARYDHMCLDLDGGGSITIDGPALGVSWWVASPIRLTSELQFLKTTGSSRDTLFTTELLWAF